MFEFLLKLGQLIQSISEFAGYREQKEALRKLEQFAAQYLKKHGEAGKQWLEDSLSSIDAIKIDKPGIKHIVTLVAEGHLSAVRDLVRVDLVRNGVEFKTAHNDVAGMCAGLLIILEQVEAADPDAALGTLVGLPPKRATSIVGIATSSVTRIICPHCYRVVWEKDIAKVGRGFGPEIVMCKACNHTVHTDLTPWNKAPSKEKISVFTVPVVILLGAIGVLVIFGSEISCLIGTAIMIFVALGMAAYEWAKARESLTIPTW